MESSSLGAGLRPPLSPGRTFWVEVPLEPPPNSRPVVKRPVERVEISLLTDSEHQSDSESDANGDPSDFESLEMQEIVGEHTWPDGKTYLYARLRDQSVRKFRPKFLQRHFGELVEEYEDMKKHDQLEDFDPTGLEVVLQDRPPAGPPSPRKPSKSSSRASRQTSESTALLDYNSAEDVSDTGSSNPSGSDSDESGSDAFLRPRRLPKRGPVLSPRKTRKSGRAPSPQSDSYSDFSAGGSTSSEGERDKKAKRGPLPKKSLKGPRVQPELGVVTSFASFTKEADGADGPLHAHMPICIKCQHKPTHLQRRTTKKKKDEFEMDYTTLGGWVVCLTCTQAIHFACLPKQDRDSLLVGIRRRARAAALAAAAADSDSDVSIGPRRTTLDPLEVTSFLCKPCTMRAPCGGCKELVPAPQPPKTIVSAPATSTPSEPPSSPAVATVPVPAADLIPPSSPDPLAGFTVDPTPPPPPALLFRCVTCLRPTHYIHLPPLQAPESQKMSSVKNAAEYHKFGWQCKDCHSYTLKVERILGWRLYPTNAVEPPMEKWTINSPLPREYLIKWVGKSYRRVQWVPHTFLLSRFRQTLSFFYRRGAPPELLEPTSHEVQSKLAQRARADPATSTRSVLVLSGPSRMAHHLRNEEGEELGDEGSNEKLHAEPDVELRIPSAWGLVDRLLFVSFLRPRTGKAKPGPKPKTRTKSRIVSPESEGEEIEEIDERRASLEDGVQPDQSLTESWETRAKRQGEITLADADDVVWAYIKWQDQPHEAATWDTPPSDEEGKKSFLDAFKRFIVARAVTAPVLTAAEARKRDARPKKVFELMDQPSWLPEKLRLKPFQLEGLTWLYENWWNHQHCILADEMGLGKTIQIATFIGKIVTEGLHIFPILIVVPNSTLTNWVRELELWAPGVHAVMYAGLAEGRDIIKKYELYRDGKPSFHVLLTTYQNVTSARDFASIFAAVPRWEVVIVDEGQRMKNDDSLLFKQLRKLNSIHRILMTGTPINNNIREIFNLLSYLDPDNWNNLDAMEEQYANLTEELVKQLHERLRPYFLRRVKEDVMKDLPRKHQIIVPINMTTLQAEVWKSLLTRNMGSIEALVQVARSGEQSKMRGRKTNKNMNNIIMQIRKCMQHPYLVDPALEPPADSVATAHKQLVEDSAKLRLLQMMLPKLKARGHRVLLFSQFQLALNVVEDFLVGEGFKFLRLDGLTPPRQRQKDMDAFNAPDSDYFIYILSTRAGGVGINLWSADVVIMHDVDFNPHNDLQAIARAHRMGQTKPVLVFTLMIKSSVEEKMIQIGKKKLILDHVIVQNMDDDASDDQLQSLISFGAKALFEDDSQIDTRYSSEDIDSLIDRVQKQETEEPVADASRGQMSFGFAKIWERRGNEDTLVQVDASAPEEADPDFWAQVLERTRKEEADAAARVKTGRGVRRKATKTTYKLGKQKGSDEGSEFEFNPDEEEQDNPSPALPLSSDDMDIDPVARPLPLTTNDNLVLGNSSASAPPAKAKRKRGPNKKKAITSSEFINDSIVINCPICKSQHARGSCQAVHVPEVREELKQVLNDPSHPEPLLVKVAAMQALYESEPASRPQKKQRLETAEPSAAASSIQPSSLQSQPPAPRPAALIPPPLPSTSNGPPRPRPIFRHYQPPVPPPVQASPTVSNLASAETQNTPSSSGASSHLPGPRAQAPPAPSLSATPPAPSLQTVKVGPPLPKLQNAPAGSVAHSQQPAASRTQPSSVPAPSTVPSASSVESRPQQSSSARTEKKPPQKIQPPQSAQKTPSVLSPEETHKDINRPAKAPRQRLLAPKPENLSPSVSTSALAAVSPASSSKPKSQANGPPSRGCRLCHEGLHSLKKCPKVLKPDVVLIRQTLAGIDISNAGFEEKLLAAELEKVLKKIEVQERAKAEAIIIDSD